MDYRSRWQQKRRERATRVRLIVIVALLIGATASMLFVRGVSRPAPSGYELPGSGISWVTASDDGVLITTRSGELVKLTPTLQPVQEGWAGPFTHPAGFRGRCVIAGPCVLVPCEDVRVRAVDLKFGIESWELEVGAAVPAITAYGERAYFTTAEPALYAATADGTELWRTELEAEAPAQPLVTNESVVVGTLAGSVCAYERATGCSGGCCRRTPRPCRPRRSWGRAASSWATMAHACTASLVRGSSSLRCNSRDWCATHPPSTMRS